MPMQKVVYTNRFKSAVHALQRSVPAQSELQRVVVSKAEDAAMRALKAKLSQIEGALKLAVSAEAKLFAAAHGADAEIASSFAALKRLMDAREKALRTELD